MNWEFVNKAPPWVIVLLVLGTGGGFSVGNLFSIGGELAEIKKSIQVLNRKMDRFSWRVDSHKNRLDGHAVKNREQDKAVQALAAKVVFLDALSARRVGP